MDAFDAYVICTSPRSGSTLLCKLLQNTGTAGFPDSHFHDASLTKWLGYYGLQSENYTRREDALKAVFAAAFDHGKGDTEMFGLRLQRHSFDFFVQELGVLSPQLHNDKSRIEAAFGRTLFVHLTREDKLEQAVSFVRAMQTGLWHIAPDGTELERLSEPKEAFYDSVAISKHLALLTKMDEDWEAWFASQKIEPLRITYEALSFDPYATLALVLANLGLDYSPPKNASLPVAKLADAINQNWIERFASKDPSDSISTDPDQGR